MMNTRSQKTPWMGKTRLAGLALAVSMLVTMAAAGLYGMRVIRRSLPSGGPSHLLERGLFITAVVLTAAGFILLWRALRGSRGGGWVAAGTLVYLVAGVIIVAGELMGVTNLVIINASIGNLQRTYVFLSGLGQTIIGVGLIQSPKTSTVIGWLTVIVSLFIFIFPLLTDDPYIPLMHHLMPLVIGVSLLIGIKNEQQKPATASSWIILLVIGSLVAASVIQALFTPAANQAATGDYDIRIYLLGVSGIGVAPIGMLATLIPFSRGERWAWFSMLFFTIVYGLVAARMLIDADNGGFYYLVNTSLLTVALLSSARYFLGEAKSALLTNN